MDEWVARNEIDVELEIHNLSLFGSSRCIKHSWRNQTFKTCACLLTNQYSSVDSASFLGNTVNMSCFLVLGMLNSPFGSILGKSPGYLPHESMSMTADFLEKFPGIARMANRLDSISFLDSRSSSPEDSETSGFSSGSDHLCDMLVRDTDTCSSC